MKIIHKRKYRWYYRLPGTFYTNGPTDYKFKYEVQYMLKENFPGIPLSKIEIWRA